MAHNVPSLLTAFPARSAIAFCPFIGRPGVIFANVFIAPMQLLRSSELRTTWILGLCSSAFLNYLTVGPTQVPKAYAAAGYVDIPCPSCHHYLHYQRKSVKVE